MMTDPIADMLTRIRNASKATKKEVELPYSKLKKSLAEVLVAEGYLAGVSEIEVDKKTLNLELKYFGKKPAITHLKRVSSPGHRKYLKSKDISKILNGFGTNILSTPKGLLTGRQAKEQRVGGEVICEIW